MVTITINPRTGEALELPRSAIQDDDWYLYDRENGSIVAAYGPGYQPDQTQTPRGLEWIRGKRLKFSMT